MTEYMYLFLGVLLGLGIAFYYFGSREEKIERAIKNKQKIFSTPKLEQILKNIVEKIEFKVRELKRELTEEEKDEIIEKCLKKEFITNK